MTQFLGRRLLQTLVVLWGLATLVFVVVRLSGDPAALLLPMEASAEEVERLRAALGLDRPWIVQYLRFLAGVIRGDFGVSFRHEVPALQLVLERLPATIELALAGILVAAVVAAPVGITAALKRNSAVDFVSRSLAILLQSMPSFWLGSMLILLFAVSWRLVPASGRGDWTQLVLPALTVGLVSAATLARILRSSVLEVLQADYVRTARVKGLPERIVIGKHVLKNAAIPVLTLAGLEVGRLLSGTIIIETVFAWPGVGRLMVQAVSNRDFPVVQGGALILAVFVLVVNLLTDLVYTVLDPRVRYG